jgi:hypothetical protein
MRCRSIAISFMGCIRIKTGSLHLEMKLNPCDCQNQGVRQMFSSHNF